MYEAGAHQARPPSAASQSLSRFALPPTEDSVCWERRWVCLQERLYLKERKGLVRLAIQTGAHIVPVYAFGSSQVFRLFWGMRFLQPLAR